jgi:hypothetical protein
MSEQEPGVQSAPAPPAAPQEEAERRSVVFAPRIDTALREQVEGIREITGQTINQVGEEALRHWIDMKLGDDEVRAQAMAGIEEEERRLNERKAAIAKVLGPAATSSTRESGPTGGRRGKAKE